MAIPIPFAGNTVLLGLISAMISLYALWAVASNVSTIERPGCCFALTNCLKNTVGKVTFLVKVCV